MDKVAESVSTTSLVSSEPDEAPRWCFRINPVWVTVLLLLATFHDGAEHITKAIAADLFPNEGARTWAISGPPVIMSLISFVSLPMVGRCADIYGRKRALLLCSSCLAVPYVCLWAFRMDTQVSSYWGFMVLFGLCGFVGGGSSIFMIAFAYLADCTTPEMRAAVAGIVQAISCIGRAEAPDTYSLLWHEGATPWRCLLAIAAFHVALIIVCAIVPESGEKGGSPRADAALNLNPLRSFRLLAQPAETTDSRSCLRVLFVVAFLLYTAKLAVKNNIDVYAMSEYDFSTTQRGRLVQMYGLTEIVGQLMFVLGVRSGVSHRSLIGIGVMFACLSPLLLAVPGIGTWALYVSNALLAMAFGASTICLAMSTEVVRPTESAEAVALVKAALQLGNAAGRGLYSCLSMIFLGSSYPGAIFLVLSQVALVGLALCFALPSQQRLQQIRDSVRPECDCGSKC